VRAISEEVRMDLWVCTEKRFISEGYCNDWGGERNPMGYVEKMGVGKGAWVHVKKAYK